MKLDRRFPHWGSALLLGLVLVMFASAAAAREAGKLANVTILATGGTIAGTTIVTRGRRDWTWNQQITQCRRTGSE